MTHTPINFKQFIELHFGSIRGFADAMEVTYPTAWAWRSNPGRIRADMIDRMAEITGVDGGEIINLINKKHNGKI